MSTTAPTPRDLFGGLRGPSRGLRKGHLSYGDINSLQPVLGPPSVPDRVTGEPDPPRHRGRIYDDGREHRRPAQGYGGDSQAISVGAQMLTIDEQDPIGWIGRPLRQLRYRHQTPAPPVVRGSELRVPEVHPAYTGRAACAGVDPDDWFDGDPGNNSVRRRVCGVCPIQRSCLAWALANEGFGFWAGHTQEQLREIRKVHEIKLRAATYGPTERDDVEGVA